MSSSSSHQSHHRPTSVVHPAQHQSDGQMLESIDDLTEDELRSLSAALEEEKQGNVRLFDIAEAARVHGLEVSDLKKRIRAR